jgi:glycosyltransferase involved in cell wall biosynthesis
MPIPKISIVLCTFNRAEMLSNALQSLNELQTHNDFEYEIVVVDNASNDATPQVVETFRQQANCTVRYAHESRKGIAFARNCGLLNATGEWIAFFDDDQLADSQWLWHLWKYATEHALLGVGGAVTLKLPSDFRGQLHATVRMLLGESLWSEQPFPYSHKISFGTGNLMLHRQVFERVGNFNEIFTTRAEDTDLFCRIHQAGIATWYVPQAIVHHVTPQERLQTNYLVRLAKHMGKGIAEREWEALPLWKFASRFAAKTLRLIGWQKPQLVLAQVRKQTNTALGLYCQETIACEYIASAWSLLRSTFINSISQLISRKSWKSAHSTH